MKLKLIAQWDQDRIEVETAIRKLNKSIKYGGVRTNWGWDPVKQMSGMVEQTFAPGQMSWYDGDNMRKLVQKATQLYKVRAVARGHQHQFFKRTYVPQVGGTEKVVLVPISREEEVKEIKEVLEQYLAPVSEVVPL